MASKTGYFTDAEMKSNNSSQDQSMNDVQIGAATNPSANRGFRYWAKRLAVETGGIERVTDEDRAQNTSKVWNACTFW